jgi:uncharacterized protein (DUF2252 family)
MAKRTVVELTDDMDGSPATRTIEFTIDGVQRSLDLNDKNAAKFEKAVAPFIEAARTVSGRGRRSSRSAKTISSKRDVHRVREWAQASGFEISARGRIPRNVVEAYEAAQ